MRTSKHQHANRLKLLKWAVLAATVVMGSGTAFADDVISRITQTPDQHGTAYLIHSNGLPTYTVNTQNDGYRVQIIFDHTRLAHTLKTVLPSGAVQNVLIENKNSSAHMDVLLKSPQAVMIEPAIGGYKLEFTNKYGLTTPSNVDEAQSNSQSVASTNTSNSKNGSQAFAQPTSQKGSQTVDQPTSKNGSQTVDQPTSQKGSQTVDQPTSTMWSTTSVTGLHFKRGPKGAGILSLNIHGEQPEMDITRQNGKLIVNMKNTSLPSSYVHRFGVTQFGTLVQYVDSYQVGTSTRLVFDIDGQYGYSAYQLGDHVMIDVHKRVAPTLTNPQDSARLSMDFQNISVRAALQVIADFTHQNIVVSSNVDGSLSIRLKNEPWQQALRVILDSQGLAVKHIGNILWVAPASQITSQEQAQLKADASKRKLEPLETRLIQIKYASAENIASLLRGFQNKADSGNSQGMSGSQQQSLATALGLPKSSIVGNSLLGPRGSVSVVTRTNSLLVRDTPDDVENIEKLIAKIDKPVPQVMIKARIVQITTNAAHSLGVNWGGTYTSNGANGVVNLSGTGAAGTTETQGGAYPISGSSSSGSSSNGFTVPEVANLAASDAGTALAATNPASLGFALGTTAGRRILDLQLQALQVDNEAKIISSPKVMTEDNEKAVISQGQEIPYQQSTSSGATAVSFKKAELSLDVTPHISPNGKITLLVDAKNNQPDYADALPSGIPITTQNVKTKLLVSNGQTIVIGGIYTDTTTNNDTGIPVLKNIPLLGWLFNSKVHSVAKTELLVFITPEIIGGNPHD